MAYDPIMLFGSLVFGLLFLFLFSTFIMIIASYFKKTRKTNYEPNISIIVPCYNEEKNIAQCLDFIHKADYPRRKLEVIVADDGSKDKTVEVAKGYKKLKLKIICGSHRGKSETLNMGVKQARYEIILTLDADTNITRDFIRKIVQPFLEKEVGATNGSCMAANKDSFFGMFQNIEYHYNNLIRKSFSSLFNNAIWFFGAFACYRKSALKKIGYFSKKSMTEDMETALAIYSKRYRITNVDDALVYTKVPCSLSKFVRQRMRWWMGGLMSLARNKKLFSAKSSPSILFLFINQYWWSVYAVLSMPLIAYQFNYWLPKGIHDIAVYTFRWFTLTGPIYVLYKIPVWGISIYSIFGVLSGIISAMLIISALYTFKDRLNLRNAVAIFLYFPYTIVLNTVIILSLVKITFSRRKYFID